MMKPSVIHGDARDLSRSIAIPGRINCLVVDPPYGVDFWSRRAETPKGRTYVAPIENDGDLVAASLLFDQVITQLSDRCAEEAEMYVFTRWDVVGTWIENVSHLRHIGWQYKMLLVWDKGIPGMGDIDCNWGCGHELILYCKKGRREVPKRRSSIIHVDKLGSKQHTHPTEKPVQLIEELLEMSTSPGDLVIDPFCGTGSTLVACNRLGRQGIGFETVSRYVDVARRRLEQGVLLL